MLEAGKAVIGSDVDEGGLVEESACVKKRPGSQNEYYDIGEVAQDSPSLKNGPRRLKRASLRQEGLLRKVPAEEECPCPGSVNHNFVLILS